MISILKIKLFFYQNFEEKIKNKLLESFNKMLKINLKYSMNSMNNQIIQQI
jgi:hypothetical protein